MILTLIYMLETNTTRHQILLAGLSPISLQLMRRQQSFFLHNRERGYKYNTYTYCTVLYTLQLCSSSRCDRKITNTIHDRTEQNRTKQKLIVADQSSQSSGCTVHQKQCDMVQGYEGRVHPIFLYRQDYSTLYNALSFIV